MSFLFLARRLTLFALFFGVSWSASAQFVTIWKSDNFGGSASNQIAINRGDASGFYNIAWAEVGNPANTGNITNVNTPNKIVTFPTAGTYRVTITGSFFYFLMGGSPDAQKLLSVEQWGTVAWTSFSNSFATCSNVVINAPDVPNLTNCISLHQAFQAATLVNTGFKNWNVSHIQDFSGMFSLATSFNDDISGWNTSNATDMGQMFAAATSFDRDISSWDVSHVTNMQAIFSGASSFNQNINNWDVHNVTRMTATFAHTDVFDQPLNNWNMNNVTDIDQMFSGATAFNQDISGWDVSHANVFVEMFMNAEAFNQNIGSWNMSHCVLSSGMFQGAIAFNQNISGWDMSDNQDISRMFLGATSFNQDISGWDVSNVTYLYATFQDATAFNQNLASWNVSLVTDMSNMFDNSGLSDTNYDNILIGWNALPFVKNDVTLGASSNFYCTALTQRATLIAVYNWTINDAGVKCAVFPSITSFTPTFGPVGTSVTITGTGFTGATAVSFGGVPASSFIVNSPTSITAIVGTGATGFVAVTTPVGTDTKGTFFFHDPPPTITSFTPTSAGAGGVITITGTNLSGTTAVNFGGSAASSFNVVSPTTITATVGGGSSGVVSLTTFSGTAFKPGFTFLVQPAPTITSFTPSSGGAGISIFISGTNFIGVTTVTIGGIAAVTFDVKSTTLIQATINNGATGDVAVTTPGGTAIKSGFTFVPVPTITSFTPTSAAPGETVTITGTNLLNAFGVRFGGVLAASYNVVSETSITAVVSAGGNSGNVTVTTLGGTASLPGFTFLVPKPVIKDGDNNAGPEVVSNQTINLGTTIINDPITRVLSISNNGSIDIDVLNVAVDNLSFSIIQQPGTIAVGSFETLEIKFSPTKIGTQSTNVVITMQGATFNFHLTAEVQQADIEVFNAVTPNGDGAHDFLHLKNIEQFDRNHVTILDRAGNEVFSVEDYNNADVNKRFEGSGNLGSGKPLTDGTYYYVIKIQLDDRTTKKYSGFLLLQR